MLGARNLQVQSRQLVRVNYSQWLDCARGEQLAGVTVTVIPVSTPATGATIDSAVVLPDRESIVFVVGGPGVVGDQFNIEVQITTTLTQSRTDLIGVTVVAIS